MDVRGTRARGPASHGLAAYLALGLGSSSPAWWMLFKCAVLAGSWDLIVYECIFLREKNVCDCELRFVTVVKR